jgi:hypothetical protein
MNPIDDSLQPTSKWTSAKRTMKKILYLLMFLILLIVAVVFYWQYFYTYSDGYRSGLLQKFSHKGTIFKTFEGELILSSVSGGNNVVIASEKFLFSVTIDSLASSLDTLQGSNVIVHYKQKNKPAFWRGDSPYLVDGVKLKTR